MSLAATSTPLQSAAPVPRLAEPLVDDAQWNGSGDVTPRASAATDATDDNTDPKKKKRSLFGFGKKKAEEGPKSPSKDEPSTTTVKAPATTPTANTSSAPSTGPPTRRTTASPINIEATHMLPPSSPGRNFSSSPRMASPAGSQIFERDVQESTVLLPNSPAIPSHIKTEDYIPPALDATSEAITDDHLDPDSVEIITHTQHQTAASTLQQPPYGEPTMSAASQHLGGGGGGSWAEELVSSFSDRDFGSGLGLGATTTDNASNYGSLENTADVRRLSFISFADVVQAEQGPPGNSSSNHRDSMHLAGLTSLPSPSFPSSGLAGGNRNRSPSPIRSPVSSFSATGGPSPPTSKSGSVHGLEMGSPARKPLGSPKSGSAHHGGNMPSSLAGGGGELNVETMAQALRRTASGDLGMSRSSVPTSPIEGPSR
ncbi:hypothetical protein GE09DRAFT_131972 [Coniochaeta sp. 2T2.1]|nr:hypothetical protein GE09DRAFT_131972 [Coniochaeta sp. 2T2.1]